MATVTRKPRRVKPARTFTCTFCFGDDVYQVFPLRGIHPEVASKAYRLKKQTGGQEVYDVRLSTEGRVECDCKGFLRWRQPCKHIRFCKALGMLL